MNTPDVLRPYARFVEVVLLTITRGQMIIIDAAGTTTMIAPDPP